MYTLLPVLPLPLMGLGAMLWVESGVRRRYLRACELQLHEWVKPFDIDGAPVPSFHRLGMGGWWTARRVVLAGMVFTALLVLYVAATFDAFLVVWRRGSGFAWIFVVYAGLLMVVIAAYAEGVFVKRAWFAAVRSLRA